MYINGERNLFIKKLKPYYEMLLKNRFKNEDTFQLLSRFFLT